jgi:hypothetical protein
MIVPRLLFRLIIAVLLCAIALLVLQIVVPPSYRLAFTWINVIGTCISIPVIGLFIVKLLDFLISVLYRLINRQKFADYDIVCNTGFTNKRKQDLASPKISKAILLSTYEVYKGF